MIVLGGIVNPDGTDGDAPLDREREVIADAHARGLPVLGICLGAQLIAQATGGSAERLPAGEVGWMPIEFAEAAASDALLAGAPRQLDVNEWHNYGCTPPADAVELARSPACIQAFRVGSTTWGWQFHVEVTRPVLEEWLCEAAAAELEQLGCRPRRSSAPTSRSRSRCASPRASPIASRGRCSPWRSRRRIVRVPSHQSRGDGAHDLPARLLRRLRGVLVGHRARPHQARARLSRASRRARQALPQVLDRLNGAFIDPELRLTTPLRRVGPKGEARFELVDWPDAISAIAAHLGAIVQEHGVGEHPQRALHGHLRADRHRLPQRFFNRLGATEVEPDTVCNNAGHVALSYVYGSSEDGFDPEAAATAESSSCGARTPRRARPMPTTTG